MNMPMTMIHGNYSDPLYIEYMRRTTPYSMLSNHFHPYYEIYYLLSGSRIYFVKDTTYRVAAGDLVFIDKNEVHKTLLDVEPAHERIVIHIDDRFVRDVLKHNGTLLLAPFQQRSPVVTLPEESRAQLKQSFTRLLAELRDKQMGYEIPLQQAVVDLLLVSSRHVAANRPPEPVYVSPLHRKISEVVRYLNAHYGDQIRIQDLAARFFISPYYMSRAFKEVTGFTLIDYLNLTRIKEAQRLLRETSLSVTAVAAQTGFENFSHFGKTFKKITRSSARDYRKNIGSPSSMND
ncbi:AraC family transcriptional regulator [Cohnella cholangitidis]|uniref:Helix-turn-helix domain-containing protein n=1 Tax=Cohnella cholangitidis TaxID=2598458 RepID=A0A7G5C2Q0_9BACL|nr:AraC family transcriptional regulator [Cohnella cholangitidis]QMV43484.1 helix-turn-helix domain-containing protein [Cohnella cholangitidis]